MNVRLLSIGVLIMSLISCQNKQTKPQTWNAALCIEERALLGEGALWHNGELLWIDIEGKKLHVTKDGATSTFAMPSKIGTIVPTANNDEFLVALTDGVYRFNRQTDSLVKMVDNPEFSIGSRFNDGKCGPDGCLWVGTYAEDKKQCALYRVGDGKIEKMLDGVTNSNGIAWCPDGKRMYYIDTPTRTVQAFDFDAAQGTISNGKVTITIPEEYGNPDGSTIDSEGNLWIGHWGGTYVTKWNPESGAFLGKVKVPAEHVTSVAFGGENLDTLFITTVSAWLPDSVLAQYPQSGCVFSAVTGATGIKSLEFSR